MPLVQPHDISIIFQGPVRSRSRNVADSIASARQHFPDAQIIFSTWQGEELAGLEKLADILVTSEPVGDVFADPFSGARDNAHRQIITTMAGLQKATRPYCMKLRSDTQITSSLFAIEQEPLLASSPYRKVAKALVALDSGSYDPLKSPFLFHVSDLAMFGTREDMLAYWDASLNAEDIAARDLEYAFWKIYCGNSGFRFSRLSVEQRVMLSFLQRHGISDARPRFLDHVNAKLCYCSEASLFANFQLVDANSCGLDLPDNLKKQPVNEWYDVSEQMAIAENLSTREHYLATRYPHIWRRKFIGTLTTPRYYKGLMAVAMLGPMKLARRILPQALLAKLFPAKR